MKVSVRQWPLIFLILMLPVSCSTAPVTGRPQLDLVVYTGLWPVAENETGLTVVMGHEIAHAVAKHGRERLSQMLVAEMAGMTLAAALQNRPDTTRQLAMSAFGAGATVGFLLPYSRVQESEADRLGLIFMAMAGYDPRAALDFWKRMAEKKEGKGPPSFSAPIPPTRPAFGTSSNTCPRHCNTTRVEIDIRNLKEDRFGLEMCDNLEVG